MTMSTRSKAFFVGSLFLITNIYTLHRVWTRNQPREFIKHELQHNNTTSSSHGIDWSRFAYLQYVTDKTLLCNSIMIFESLHRLQSRADRVLLYPNTWDSEEPDGTTTALFELAKKNYGVRCKPIEVIKSGNNPTWASGFTKFLIFNQTEYARVLMLDSDANVQQSMDELFLSPSAIIAMPRAYWLGFETNKLGDHVILAEPSSHQFERLMGLLETSSVDDMDMEIFNTAFKNSCLVLPHRPYGLLTGEFKTEPLKHAGYLGDPTEIWDPEKVLKEAKYIHFSDWPVPKPWISMYDSLLREHQPKCWKNNATQEEDCTAQKIWRGFYSEYLGRRKAICGLDALAS